jgi:LysM repeat protein
MHRTLIPTGLATLLLALTAACGSEASSSAETLPPIRTTTSTTTTTTMVDQRERIYIVQPGDNVSEIARAYEVTAQMIITLNGLPADGEIQPGQELKIPNIRVDTELPTTVPTSDPDES